MTLEQKIALVPMTIMTILWLIYILTPDKSKQIINQPVNK